MSENIPEADPVNPPRPVGSPLELTEEESSLISPSTLREYRAHESKKIQDFIDEHAKKRSAAVAKYHSDLATHKKKSKPDKAGLDLIEGKHKNALDELEVKRTKEWNKVNIELHELMAGLVKQAAADMETQWALDPRDRVPRAGRWITFPLWNMEDGSSDALNGEAVMIRWTAANTVFQERYYKTTCWYGTLEYDPVLDPNPLVKPAAGDKPEHPKDTAEVVEARAAPAQRWKASVRLNPFGETTLFIAAEFIETRYQGAPHLRGLHLRDNSPPGTKWAYMRIDHALHYGQNYRKATHRYLVYHPFVRTRNIPQAAFADNVLLETAKSAAKSASTSKTPLVAQGGAVMGGVTTLVASLMADRLHRFPALKGEKGIYDISATIRELEDKWNVEDRDLYKHLDQASVGVGLARCVEEASVELARAAEHAPAGGQDQGDLPEDIDASIVSLIQIPWGEIEGDDKSKLDQTETVEELGEKEWLVQAAVNKITNPSLKSQKSVDQSRSDWTKVLPPDVNEPDLSSPLEKITNAGKVTKGMLDAGKVNLGQSKK